MEARAALSRSGITTLPSNQSPMKMDMPPINSMTGQPPASIRAGSFFLLIRKLSLLFFSACLFFLEIFHC